MKFQFLLNLDLNLGTFIYSFRDDWMVSIVANTGYEDNHRFYFLWKCDSVREGMRPLGRPETRPCKKWNITSSKHQLGQSKYLQATCKKCGRKSRLNPNTRTIHECPTKDGARIIKTQLESLDKAQRNASRQENSVSTWMNHYDVKPVQPDWDSGWEDVGEEE